MITYKDLNTFTQVLEKLSLSPDWMKDKFYTTWGSTKTDLVYLYLMSKEELQKDELELLESLNEVYHVVTVIDLSYLHSADTLEEIKNAVIQGQPENIEKCLMNFGLEDLQEKWDGNP